MSKKLHLTLHTQRIERGSKFTQIYKSAELCFSQYLNQYYGLYLKTYESFTLANPFRMSSNIAQLQNALDKEKLEQALHETQMKQRQSRITELESLCSKYVTFYWTEDARLLPKIKNRISVFCYFLPLQ